MLTFKEIIYIINLGMCADSLYLSDYFFHVYVYYIIIYIIKTTNK
jgi:hypothetical protein